MFQNIQIKAAKDSRSCNCCLATNYKRNDNETVEIYEVDIRTEQNHGIVPALCASCLIKMRDIITELEADLK